MTLTGGPYLEVRQREVEVGWAGLANWADRAAQERKEGGRRRWVGLEGERGRMKFFLTKTLFE